MNISSKPKPTLPTQPSPIKSSKTLQTSSASKGNSCHISISKNGEELSLRPNSLHRYKASTESRQSSSAKLSKHSRSSTHTSGFSKFIPATELVSFEVQTFEQEEFTDEVSEDELSGLHFEDEPRHRVVYPSLHSNRHSMIGSTVDNPSSAASSPLDQRFVTYYTLNSGNEGKIVNRGKESFVGSNEQIYCQKCKENVNFWVKVKNLELNL